MKLKSAVLFALLAGVCGPALADATQGDPQTCALSGPVKDATQDCQALRLAYRGKLRACLDRLQDEADQRAGHPSPGSAQSSRARFLICDAALR